MLEVFVMNKQKISSELSTVHQQFFEFLQVCAFA